MVFSQISDGVRIKGKGKLNGQWQFYSLSFRAVETEELPKMKQYMLVRYSTSANWR